MDKTYDVIIIGTGVSGLFCALHLPKHLNVLMITKGKLEESNSFLAQGGICVLKDDNDFESYVEDTMRAGKFENDKVAVETMIHASRDIINELIELGVDFDEQDGKLIYTKEAAHSTNRILHHKDVTGKEITSKLLAAVKRQSHITLVEDCQLVELIKDNKNIQGIMVYYQKDYRPLYANSIVLATGGIGGIFEASTNYAHLTGDALALALKHEIAVKDINYIQIHPTTLYSSKQGKRFLISEAVRGEGAYLLNEKGERFVDELLPRDIVSKKINEEMIYLQTDHVYLSVTHLNGDYIKSRFPNIYKACQEEGYDLTKERIPVTPAQHYFMGGIVVDLDGKTSLKGLYAIGETSRTGVHGANRLASNSLLEGLVFARRAAMSIARQVRKVPHQVERINPVNINQSIEEIEASYKALLLEQIKRKDGTFYARWFHKQYKCG